MLICFGLWISFISCSTIDYFSYSNNSHSSKVVNDNQINLITYNIKAIYQKEQNEVDNLMEYIASSDFDFVIFQELFNESTRDYIIEKTDTSHFTTIISRVDYNSFPEFIFQDAGLFMMSRYPRVDLTDIEFGDGINNSNGVIHMILEKEMSKTNDFLANKSVLGALFEIDQATKLFLFTTHVQAIGTTEIKETQLRQIKYFIDEAATGVLKAGTVKSSENMIVLLAGDFNSNAYDKERFASMMNILGYPRDLHKELHGEKEEYTFRFGSNNASRRFDYIMVYDSIGSAIFRDVEVESIGTIDIKDDAGNSISDHVGLKADLRIN
jgi:endonuclease/exonuclease/phosphatase family metal-dependent hydrolase